MSKILKSFGLAALLVALLAGTGMADTTAGATVNGCLLTADYLELKSTSLTTPMDLGLLPGVDENGGKLEVLAEDAWAITVKDNAEIGKMKTGAATYLTDPLQVNDVSLGTDTGVEIATGSATTDCVYDEANIVYDQTLQAGDTTVGTYTIAITYTLAQDV